MRNFGHIFWHEYTRHVLRRRFLIALLSMPLWLIFVFVIAVVGVLLQFNRAPVGYVDHAHILQSSTLSDENVGLLGSVPFLAYASEGDARTALQDKKIQAYFVVAADYRQSLQVQLYYLDQPDALVTQQFSSLLRQNLLSNQPPAIAQRVIDGPSLVLEATQDNQQLPDNNWVKVAIPIAAAVFLIASMFTSSGYLMQAVVEEKENRTMEILATSAAPGTIMSGKIIALISVGLTQMLAWSLIPLIALGVARANIPSMQTVQIDSRLILLFFVTTLPTFLLISTLMATIGATVTDEREGQQVSTLVTLPVILPFMLIAVFMSNPDSLLSQVLTFFPLTAALSLLLRMAFSTVPTWQIYVSSGILIISALGALWLAGRVFRMGMLQYGKRMGWKDIAQAAFPRRMAKERRLV